MACYGGRAMRTQHAAVVVLLTLGGCIEFEKDSESGAPGPTSPPLDETTGDAADTSGGGELPTTGGAVDPGQCDLWAQDCAADAKCAPYDAVTDGVVDSTRCVPLADAPRQAGDPCKLDGIVGRDDCDLGLMCWNLKEGGEGTCVPLCTGSPQSPTCGEGLVCDVAGGGVLPLCLTTCDPLAPSCPMGQICIPASASTYVCDADGSGDAGAYGDECAYVNVCDSGLLCTDASNVPGCESPGCCTEYCDLTQPAGGQCSGAPAQECLPIFETPPPGHEDVGFCGIPA